MFGATVYFGQRRIVSDNTLVIPVLMLTFLSRENGEPGESPGGTRPPEAARPVTPILMLTFFSRENGGPGGIPRRDKAARGGTSRYSAFLC